MAQTHTLASAVSGAPDLKADRTRAQPEQELRKSARKKRKVSDRVVSEPDAEEDEEDQDDEDEDDDDGDDGDGSRYVAHFRY